MIYLPHHGFYGGKYIYRHTGLQRKSLTRMSYCPESVPPSYDDYTTCSNNVFHIYKN